MEQGLSSFPAWSPPLGGRCWHFNAEGVKLITRDYVLYLTSNRVLIGAEIDKVVSILTVTAIIAVAIGRARWLLVRAVAEGAAAYELSRFFAPEMAHQITAAEQEAMSARARRATPRSCSATSGALPYSPNRWSPPS